MEFVSEVGGAVCGRGEDCHLCREDAERWFCGFNLAPLSRFLPAPEGVRDHFTYTRVMLGTGQLSDTVGSAEQVRRWLDGDRCPSRIKSYRIANTGDIAADFGRFTLEPGYCLVWDGAWDDGNYTVSRMYGWPFEPEETPQPKKPEPSPVEREIERMMEKRKAKREGSGAEPAAPTAESDKAWAKHVKDRNNGEALERAISKLTHWEQTVHERIMPCKGIPL